ncbi:MAG: hypothetical protein KDC05_02785 [Bacteroidales bacterium]|nr:hypothetical protein [Bacteroidales bacterium]
MSIFNVVELFKLLQVLLVSGIKFLFGPLVSLGYGFTWIETVALTTAGGILGLVFFYHLSKWVIRQLNRMAPAFFTSVAYLRSFGKDLAETGKRIKPVKKKFTRKNKLIIQIRNKYGFLGIILLTPVLLSIPIGAFLAQKYYSRKKHTLVYLSLSVMFWSFCISSFLFLVR